jgi:sugar lactone lactonase YvrE
MSTTTPLLNKQLVKKEFLQVLILAITHSLLIGCTNNSRVITSPENQASVIALPSTQVSASSPNLSTDFPSPLPKTSVNPAVSASPVSSTALKLSLALSITPSRYAMSRPGEHVRFYVIAKDKLGKYLEPDQLKLIWSLNKPHLAEMFSPGSFRYLSGSGTVIVSVRETESGSEAHAEIIVGPNSSPAQGSSSNHSGPNTVPGSPTPPFGCLGNCGLSVIAGTGHSGKSGDSELGVNAELNEPRGIAVSKVGDVYISDTLNHQVRKLDASTGVINRWAGTGRPGDISNVIPAIFAGLNFPRGLALDLHNNLFIAEHLNHRVQVVIPDSEPTIFNFAGTGRSGPLGQDVPADQAQLNLPSDVAFDSDGNLYIADALNHAVRKVNAQSEMSTVAGTGFPGFRGDEGDAKQAQLHLPYSIAVNNQGDLFIADTQNHRIRKIDKISGKISTYAGTGQAGFTGDGGQAKDAQLNEPNGIALDLQGNLYIADTFNNRIRMINAQTGHIATLLDGQDLLNPYDVAVDDLGHLYIADTLHHQIKKLIFKLNN